MWIRWSLWLFIFMYNDNTWNTTFYTWYVILQLNESASMCLFSCLQYFKMSESFQDIIKCCSNLEAYVMKVLIMSKLIIGSNGHFAESLRTEKCKKYEAHYTRLGLCFWGEYSQIWPLFTSLFTETPILANKYWLFNGLNGLLDSTLGIHLRLFKRANKRGACLSSLL